jgi:hypothetical protein
MMVFEELTLFEMLGYPVACLAPPLATRMHPRLHPFTVALQATLAGVAFPLFAYCKTPEHYYSHTRHIYDDTHSLELISHINLVKFLIYWYQGS